MCPYMTNLDRGGDDTDPFHRLGDAAAIYTADDLYVPRRFVKAFPEAIGFLLVKTDQPRTLRPITNVEEIVALIWAPDRENVRAYLVDETRRRELEPMYLGPWVADTSKAIIAPLSEVR